MDIDFGHEARDTIRRLREVNRTTVLVDHARAEDALQRHLAALNLAPMPIRWVADAKSGLMGSHVAAFHTVYRTARGSVYSLERRPPDHSAYSRASDAANSAAYSAAWNVAYNTVFNTSRTVRSVRNTVFSVVENAAWSVAYSASEYVAPSPANKISSVWVPFVDAFEAGLWLFWVTDAKIIAVPRPALSMDVGARLHCETGPAVSWPNGATYWFWKGTQVSRRTVEAPETLTIEQIDHEANAEVRRIMIERFGAERYIREGNAKLIASDPVHGDLYRKRRKYDTNIVMLHVRNNTIEPDGTIREFWLRIHPECRPFRARDKWVGEPQKMTPLNARASTWGLTGEVFKHLAEAS